MAKCAKVKFPSELSAQLRIKEIALQNTRFRRPNRHYQCDMCGMWHLTSESQATFANRKKWVENETAAWVKKNGLKTE